MQWCLWLLLCSPAAGLTGNKTVTVPPLQVYYTSTEVGNTIVNAQRIHINTPFWVFDHYCRIVYKDHHVEKVPVNNIWGYSDEDGHLFRKLSDGWYQVQERAGAWIIYTHHAYNRFYSATGYFFSYGLDGEVFSCHPRQLHQHNFPEAFPANLQQQYF
jgi:hypothetical protein